MIAFDIHVGHSGTHQRVYGMDQMTATYIWKASGADAAIRTLVPMLLALRMQSI